MSTWNRWLHAGRKLLHIGDEEASSPPAAQPPGTGPVPASGGDVGVKKKLSGWVEERAQKVVQHAYESHAEDLEQRALRVMSSVYQQTADDMEERAARALRVAITSEADRIKEAIEHGIEVKKREVRLSLLVLVVSSLVYLALYWFTSRPPA
jgi:hypothetical protein